MIVLRDGKVAIADAFAVVRDGEVYLQHLDIPEYSHGNRMNHDPKRKRKLLLHKQEIIKITVALNEKGLTLIELAPGADLDLIKEKTACPFEVAI